MNTWTTLQVVQDFIRTSVGQNSTGVDTYGWARKHNESHHDITADQLEYMRKLEDEGRAEASYIVAGQAILDHNKDHAESVGVLSKLYDGLKDSIRQAFGGSTIEEQIAALEKQINSGEKQVPFGVPGETYRIGTDELAGLIEERARLIRQKNADNAAVLKFSQDQQQDESKASALKYYADFNKDHEDWLAKRKRARDKFDQKTKDAGLSQTEKDRAYADIDAQFKPPKHPAGSWPEKTARN